MIKTGWIIKEIAVSLRFEEMIKFDRVKDRESFEKQRKQLEEIMLPGLIV
jgi:hypothetical protein